ncbi:MAG TPA: MOSC domain-containing protein [Mycobacteriales bacterium]|nr:MOSC domain-containing protein [Mycobacteriales bacterium]
MRVHRLARYPVKALQGEAVASAEVDRHGVTSDRRYAVQDVESGLVASLKNPRRWSALLTVSARAHDDGSVGLRGPDAVVSSRDVERASAHLSRWCGRPVRLVEARQLDAPVIERLWPEVEGLVPDDVLAQAKQSSPAGWPVSANGLPGGDSFVDSGRVHLISAATLRHLDLTPADGLHRFRPNVVVAGAPRPYNEDAWVGKVLRIGSVVLKVDIPTPRCIVPTLAHDSAPERPEILRVLAAEHRVLIPEFGTYTCAGVYADVVAPGVIRQGDDVHVSEC